MSKVRWKTDWDAVWRRRRQGFAVEHLEVMTRQLQIKSHHKNWAIWKGSLFIFNCSRCSRCIACDFTWTTFKLSKVCAIVISVCRPAVFRLVCAYARAAFNVHRLACRKSHAEPCFVWKRNECASHDDMMCWNVHRHNGEKMSEEKKNVFTWRKVREFAQICEVQKEKPPNGIFASCLIFFSFLFPRPGSGHSWFYLFSRRLSNILIEKRTESDVLRRSRRTSAQSEREKKKNQKKHRSHKLSPEKKCCKAGANTFKN